MPPIMIKRGVTPPREGEYSVEAVLTRQPVVAARSAVQRSHAPPGVASQIGVSTARKQDGLQGLQVSSGEISAAADAKTWVSTSRQPVHTPPSHVWVPTSQVREPSSPMA
jgi:hypothetical protein